MGTVQDFDVCDDTLPNIAPMSDFMKGRDYISRKFQGMPMSEVICQTLDIVLHNGYVH